MSCYWTVLVYNKKNYSLQCWLLLTSLLSSSVNIHFYWKLEHWIMQFRSFHRHKHYMLTEPLYHTCTRRPFKPEVFSHTATFCLFLQNRVGKIYLYFETFLLKLFNPLAFVGYEMIIANSALQVSFTIYHLISNTCLWNNCLLATSVLVNSFCLLATSLNGILCQAKCIVSIKLKQVCFHF